MDIQSTREDSNPVGVYISFGHPTVRKYKLYFGQVDHFIDSLSRQADVEFETAATISGGRQTSIRVAVYIVRNCLQTYISIQCSAELKELSSCSGQLQHRAHMIFSSPTPEAYHKQSFDKMIFGDLAHTDVPYPSSF